MSGSGRRAGAGPDHAGDRARRLRRGLRRRRDGPPRHRRGGCRADAPNPGDALPDLRRRQPGPARVRGFRPVRHDALPALPPAAGREPDRPHSARQARRRHRRSHHRVSTGRPIQALFHANCGGTNQPRRRGVGRAPGTLPDVSSQTLPAQHAAAVAFGRSTASGCAWRSAGIRAPTRAAASTGRSAYRGRWPGARPPCHRGSRSPQRPR